MLSDGSDEPLIVGSTDPSEPASADSAQAAAEPSVVDNENPANDEPDQGGVSDLLRNLLEWVVVLVFAVIIALVVRSYLFQSFYIESGSMETTLEINDRVIVNRLSYRWGEPDRGEIVVFRRDGPDVPGQTKDLIKRVIAVAGDTVEATDGQLIVNGVPLFEPYLDEGVATGNFGPVTVPEGHLWLMGDNRNNSSDSRFFGPIAEDRVVGRAFIRYWPLGRAGAP